MEKKGDEKLSREAGESSHTVITEEPVKSFTSEALSKQIRRLMKNTKHSGSSEHTISGDVKLSREAGESSHTRITEEPVKSFSDSEAGSPKHALSKQIRRLMKNTKHSGSSDHTIPGLSREAGESSHTVITEEPVKSLSDSEAGSPKHALSKQMRRLMKNTKHSGSPVTLPGDVKLSREAGESSHTRITEEPVKSFSDSEAGSSKRALSKQIRRLMKNTKHSGSSEHTISGDVKLSREAGESSHTMVTEEPVKSFSDSEAGSSKRALSKQIRRLMKNTKHSGSSDHTISGLSREAGESSHTVITEEPVESFSDSEAGSPKHALSKQMRRLMKNTKHSGSPVTLPGDVKLSREAGESSHTVITESYSDSEEGSPKRGLSKKFRQLMKNTKRSGGLDTMPGERKLSRKAVESSNTVITLKSFSDSEAHSSKFRFKKRITRLMKNSKRSRNPDTLQVEVDKTSRAVGGSSFKVMAGEMRRPAEGSAKKKNVQQMFQCITNPRVYAPAPESLPEVPVVLDFNQNLELDLLAEASQQLLAREEQLFSSQSTNEQVGLAEEEKERLERDYEILMVRLWMAVKNSFNKKNQVTLKSAVTAMVQEEERDRLWEEVAKNELPNWRPMKCREWHDTLLHKVVDKRMQRTDKEENVSDNLTKMSELIQNDLFYVVRELQSCYPPEVDICHMYAQLYHQAFISNLRLLPRFHIPIQDCIVLLQQISNYSNNVLHHSELETDISSEALEPLLPEEDLNSLEEQYLLHREGEVRTLLSNALKLEEQSWQITDKSQLTDGYYCTLALDTIHFVDIAIKEATGLLSKKDKAQRILFLLPDLLASYKNSIEELLKTQINNSEILKANLFNIFELRKYIKDRPDLNNGTKTTWLSTAAEIRDSCHKYFLGPIHDELKVNYSMLWTATWFSEHCEVIEELENKLIEKISPLSDLYPACLQELLGQLHFEVMIKYVRKMMKRKLKLKNREEQEIAADLLCEDSSRINTLFITNGSDRRWLCEILPKVSEVIKVQDPDALELEICTLLKEYPDITEQQVCAILQLKTNVSCADKRMIKECYHQNISLPVL